MLKGRRELYNVLSSRPKRLQDKAQYGDAVFTMASGADYDVADGGVRLQAEFAESAGRLNMLSTEEREPPADRDTRRST